jgi:thiol:disulfide interchange protein
LEVGIMWNRRVSKAGSSSPRSHEAGHVSIWFVLLMFAAAILIGWAIGHAPTPRTTPSQPSASETGGAASGAASSGELSQWTTYDAALEESRRTGKPVMLDFNAEWCGPCQAMKRDVFDDHAHSQVVRSAVIPVSVVDRSREEGHNPAQTDELQARYRIDAFPTLVVFSPASGRVQQTAGYGGGDATLRWIEEAAKAVR